MTGPGANHEGEPKEGSRRRLPVRVARMEPRLHLPVVELAWSVAAGPAFPEDLDDGLTSRGVEALVALTTADLWLTAVNYSIPPLSTPEPLCGYMQMLVAKRFVVVQHLMVHPAVQRRGVGRVLFREAANRLQPFYRPRLIVDLPQGEKHLAGHQFLAAHGLVGRTNGPELLRFELELPTPAA